MAKWKPGESGNPLGNPGKDKLFRTALLMELKDAGEDMPALRRIAKKVIQCAEVGESWAVKEVADRLDGKVPMMVTADAEEFRKATDLTDDQLAAIAARGLVDAAEASTRKTRPH